jgi:hypothetical protein
MMAEEKCDVFVDDFEAADALATLAELSESNVDKTQELEANKSDGVGVEISIDSHSPDSPSSFAELSEDSADKADQFLKIISDGIDVCTSIDCRSAALKGTDMNVNGCNAFCPIAMMVTVKCDVYVNDFYAADDPTSFAELAQELEAHLSQCAGIVAVVDSRSPIDALKGTKIKLDAHDAHLEKPMKVQVNRDVHVDDFGAAD